MLARQVSEEPKEMAGVGRKPKGSGIWRVSLEGWGRSSEGPVGKGCTLKDQRGMVNPKGLGAWEVSHKSPRR